MRRCKSCEQKKFFSEFERLKSGHYRGTCQACRREQRRRRYRAMKDEEAREYRRRHPNRAKAPRPSTIARNRERMRRWRKQNSEIYAAQQARALAREQARGFPSAAKRRAMEFQAFIEHIDRRTLYGIYQGRCGICDGSMEFAKMTIDHIIPLSRGGKHSYENTQPAHAACNRRKSNKLPHEYEADLRAA